jgi:hypothetical protein
MDQRQGLERRIINRKNQYQEWLNAPILTNAVLLSIPLHMSG